MMLASFKHSLAALGLILCSSFTHARDVESPLPLLIEALEAGSAEGTLVGPMAETFSKLFKTNSPLVYKVRRLRQLTPNCGRMEVTATQSGVLDRDSKTVSDKPRDKNLTYEVSICSDGTPYTAPPQGASK